MKEAEEELRDHARFLDTSLDLYCLATSTTIVKCMGAWEKWLGWNSRDLTGREWRELLHPDDHPIADEAVERLMVEDLMEIRTRWLHADGHYVLIQWRTRQYLDEDGTGQLLTAANGRPVTECYRCPFAR